MILFRTLDATAELVKAVDLRGHTIVSTGRCNGHTALGNMGVHRCLCELAVDGEGFCKVDTSFGWCVPEVLEQRTGLDHGTKLPVWNLE